jgi:Plasmid pRiA4b ORF-3-like protein
MQTDCIIDIKLKGVKPRISRRVQVSLDLKLNRFHEVIQTVMGWSNNSAHLFTGLEDDYGDPREVPEFLVRDERRARVSDLFRSDFLESDTASYVYDLDENWCHEIRLSDIVETATRPRLLNGHGLCPPEGIGGSRAYQDFKTALKNRSHPFWKINPGLMRSCQQIDLNAFPVHEADEQLALMTARWGKKSRSKPRPSCRSIVLLDAKPIHDRHRQNLLQARAELRQIESELEQFKRVDSSLFRSWMYTTFSIRMSRLRNLSEECAVLVTRLNLTQQFQEHGVKHPGCAYGKAVRVETGREPMPDFPPQDFAKAPDEPSEADEMLRQAARDLASHLGLPHDSLDEEVNNVLSDQSAGTPIHPALREECRSIYRKK